MLLCPACGLYVLQEQQHLQYLGLPVQWHQTSTGKPIEQLHSDSPAAAAYVHRGCPFGALQWQQSPALHIMKKAAAVFLTSFCRQHAGLVFWGCDFLLISAPAAVCDSFCRNAALRRMQQQCFAPLLCCSVQCTCSTATCLGCIALSYMVIVWGLAVQLCLCCKLWKHRVHQPASRPMQDVHL